MTHMVSIQTPLMCGWVRILFNSAHRWINKLLFCIIFILFSSTSVSGQVVEYVYPVTGYGFRAIIDEELCNQCEIFGPEENLNCHITDGVSYSPEGLLYGVSSNPSDVTLCEIEYSPFSCTPILLAPSTIPPMMGLVAMGGDIFYTMAWQSDILYQWDTNAGTVTIVGNTGYPCWGDMCVSSGNVYYVSRTFGPNTASIVQLNLTNPINSAPMCYFESPYGIFGLSATTDPNVLVGVELYLAGNDADLYRINLLDCSLNFVCAINPGGYFGAFPHITTLLEHDLYPYSNPYIDLDCDDSSGATDSDFNASPFDCISGGSHIIDTDPRIKSDAAIDQMTITLANPIPNAPDEVLDLTGTVPGITVIGIGTPMLTLTNTGGATLNNFLDQIALVVYLNVSYDIIDGLRTVEVQFVSSTGAQSNIAKAYINVEDLPNIEFDLGPDIITCDGETVILSVNNPGEQSMWSTGEDTEEISVTSPGIYSVTVTNATSCPNRDTVEVQFLPTIQVWLTGDTTVCVDESVQLTITTDATFLITVTVTPDPGDPFTLEDISGIAHFTDLPSGVTDYVITEVLTSQPACVQLPDPSQTIDMWPDYSSGLDTATLCLGDSILLGNSFYYDSGQYEVTFLTIHGCDSIVDYTITLLPTEHLYYTNTTCDPSQAGVILTFLPNANECDTVVHTTYTLLPIDTTTLQITTCRLANTGITTDTLINQFGCDSFLVTTALYDPPQDTTFLIQYTCDSASTGIFTQLFDGSSGCDSLDVTQVVIPAPDTTTLLFTSCDPLMVGVTEMLLDGIDGCDSLVITQTDLIQNDTTHVLTSSCDSANLGTFITIFPLPGDCDSVVITQVEFSLADSTFLSEGSCFDIDTGFFMTTLTNQFGCDSFVFRTVNLLPSHDMMISLSSCFPQDTGSFIQSLVNQWGCDSIVTTQVSLLPSHTTALASTTCDLGQAGQFITVLQNQFGCDSTITLNVEYLEPDTTVLGDFTCEIMEVGVVETLYQNTHGCDSLVISTIDLFPLPQVVIQSLFDYSGYDVSCFGGNDGSLEAEVTGLPAFQYLWSTGFDQALLQDVSAGTYFVSVTDGNGCVDSDEWNVTEPLPLEIALQVSEPECFEDELGIIIIVAEGGIGPYQYSLDSISFTDNPVFESLGDGLYKLYVLDQNDCITSEFVGIHIPFPVSVDLGDNQILGLGDSTLITAMVNVPFALLDSISWTGITGSICDTCLQQWVSPFITSVYAIEVINSDGCRAADDMTITVVRNDEIYVPNVFSPNGDGINDLMQISTGSFVESIQTFEVFDRWGNLVFEQHQVATSDPRLAWDGTFHNQPLNPAVYAFRMIARLRDGSSVIRSGDVTLVR